MNDLERFENFFKEMGVVYETLEEEEEDFFSPPTVLQPGGKFGKYHFSPLTIENITPKTTLSVAQSGFFFNEFGQYIGVHWDNMGYFNPRIK